LMRTNQSSWKWVIVMVQVETWSDVIGH
jgi:hypothetical protein